MCNFYMMYWTKHTTVKRSICFTFGPPYYSWEKNEMGLRRFSNVPAEAEASGITSEEIRAYFVGP